MLPIGVNSTTASITLPFILTTRTEAAGVYIYTGAAAAGAATSAAVWQVKRLDTSDAELPDIFANGSTKFDQVWDDRATLSYS